jgi:hypothetical protein
LRLTLSDHFAKVARNHPDDPSIGPLTQLLRWHPAAITTFASPTCTTSKKSVGGRQRTPKSVVATDPF